MSPPGNKQEDSKGERHSKATINPMIINKVPVGEASSPYEVLQIQTESGLFPVVVIYDTGSEVSLCNFETGPIITSAKEESREVAISTINSTQAKRVQAYTLDLKDGQMIAAIIIPLQ